MSASYTKTITDLKIYLFSFIYLFIYLFIYSSLEEEREKLICNCKTEHTFVYVSIHSEFHLRYISHTGRTRCTHMQDHMCINYIHSIPYISTAYVGPCPQSPKTRLFHSIERVTNKRRRYREVMTLDKGWEMVMGLNSVSAKTTLSRLS